MAQKTPQRAPLDKILTGRKLSDDDSLAELMASIRENGYQLKVPVLVDAEFRLIDGLRRVEAHRLLGETSIEVDVSKDFDTTVRLLERAHTLGQVTAKRMTPRRAFEIWDALTDQIVERQHLIRRRLYKGDHGLITRSAVANAIGVANGTYLGNIAQIFRGAEVSGPLQESFRDAVRRLDEGQESIPTIIDSVRRFREKADKVVDTKEQFQILSRVALSLGGVVRPLGSLGDINASQDQEALTEVLEQLKVSRRIIERTINQIRKVLDSE